MGLGRGFACGCLACPDNSCCLEVLSSLGQAQLMFSELPINKGKYVAYVTPWLDGSHGIGQQIVQEVQADMGVSAVPSLPLSHPLRAILSKPSASFLPTE